MRELLRFGEFSSRVSPPLSSLILHPVTGGIYGIYDRACGEHDGCLDVVRGDVIRVCRVLPDMSLLVATLLRLAPRPRDAPRNYVGNTGLLRYAAITDSVDFQRAPPPPIHLRELVQALQTGPSQ